MKTISEMTNFELRKELLFGNREKVLSLASEKDSDFRRVEGMLIKLRKDGLL